MMAAAASASPSASVRCIQSRHCRGNAGPECSPPPRDGNNDAIASATLVLPTARAPPHLFNYPTRSSGRAMVGIRRRRRCDASHCSRR